MKHLALLALSASWFAAESAVAAEGSLPVRAGDVVRGTLAQCGDRQVAEVELAKGETLRLRVDLEAPGSPPELRILTADRVDVTSRAKVHLQGETIVGGPFRAPVSGVYRITLTSYTAHQLVYEMKTTLKQLPRRTVRVAGRGRTTNVLASAGSLLLLKTRPGADARVVIGFPGEAPRELATGDPFFAALTGPGVSAPCSGSYSFSLKSGPAAKLVVTPTSSRSVTTVDFPALAGDAVRAWYPGAGWVTMTPSSGTLPSTPEPSPDPDAVVWTSTLEHMVAAPAPTLGAFAGADASTALGSTGVVGMPLSGAPSLRDVFAAQAAAGATSAGDYRFAATRPGFENVTYHVQFTIDGRASGAPLSLASGRVSMNWSVTSAAPLHVGNWTLTFDPLRKVQVLDGHEIVMDAAGRTTSVAARGFALGGATSGPTGSLTWNYVDARNAIQIARRETYEAGDVSVDVGSTVP